MKNADLRFTSSICSSTSSSVSATPSPPGECAHHMDQHVDSPELRATTSAASFRAARRLIALPASRQKRGCGEIVSPESTATRRTTRAPASRNAFVTKLPSPPFAPVDQSDFSFEVPFVNLCLLLSDDHATRNSG